MFQDRKVIIKTMKTYMVKFATVSPQLLVHIPGVGGLC